MKRITLLALCISAFFVFFNHAAWAADWENGILKIDENNFPDEGFRNYLKRYGDVTTDRESFATGDIPNIKSIVLQEKDVKNLTGIRFFTSLEELYLEKNKSKFEELDLSNFESLKTVVCRWNSNTVTKINVSGCKKLTTFHCNDNNLVELDISGCTSLTAFECSNNTSTLKKINANGCIALSAQGLENIVGLEDLNLNGCKNLSAFSLHGSKVKSLDISGCEVLTELNVTGKGLESLKVDNCIGLKKLYCDNNSIQELKVSTCNALEYLQCGVNDLKELDASNLKNLKELYCNENKSMKDLKVTGCEALEELNCGNDALKELDVSGLTNLKVLLCPNNITNSMTSLNITGCKALATLDCRGQKIKTIATTSCEELKILSCDVNEIKTLDLSKNKKLGTLSCRSNKLNNLDISALTDLVFFDCRNNFLRDLDASKCTALKYIYCSGQITEGLNVIGTGSADIPYQASLKSFVKNTGDILRVQGFVSASDIFSASYEASTGTVNFSRKPAKVIYNVRTKSGSLNALMDVTIEDLNITEFVPPKSTSGSVTSDDTKSGDINMTPQNPSSDINLNQNNSDDSYAEDTSINNEGKAIITEDLAATLRSRDIDYTNLEYDEIGTNPEDVSEILNQTNTPVISSNDVLVDSSDNATALAFTTDAPTDTVFYIWLIDPSSLGFTGYDTWPDDGKQNGKQYHLPTRQNGILFYGPFLGVVKNGSIGVDVKNLYYAEDIGDYSKQSRGLIPAIPTVFYFKSAALSTTNFSAASGRNETFRSQVLLVDASLSVSELADLEKNNNSSSQEQDTNNSSSSGCNSGSSLLILVLLLIFINNGKIGKIF